MVEYIADVGTSWLGDYDLLDHMVCRLQEMGATAFKPQVWPRSIYKGHELEAEALRCHIDKRAIEKIERIAERNGIEAFYSVFDKRSLNLVRNNTKAKRVKFSYSMRCNGSLLADAMLTDQFKQVIISVSSFNDYIYNVMGAIRPHLKQADWPNKVKGKVFLLYCVPNYPTENKDLNLSTGMRSLQGLSDHTTDILAPVMAVTLGAKVIEKHVMANQDEYLLHLGQVSRFPDDVCAITLDRFKRMIEKCNQASEMMN